MPYNPYLSKKYRCHINVEACSSVKACKYLFKYIYKGNDRAVVGNAPANEIPPEAHNEISKYQDLRSIGPSEACWQLFDFPMSSWSPPIIASLEDGQMVYFGQGQARQVAAGPPPKTHLTAWFQYNREHPNHTQHYLYCDIPEHFVWDACDTHWKTRQRNPKKATPGRVHSVHPSAGELYFFHILLHHEQSRAKVSWEDVREVNGIQYDTFRATCHHLGLLHDDTEWNTLLEDAALTFMCQQMRELFVTLLLFCNTAEPAILFEQHNPQMGDDFIRQIQAGGGAEPTDAELCTMV